jgi:hypothetical protein
MRTALTLERKAKLSVENLQKLKALRDHLVEDRRRIVSGILADPATAAEASADFIGLQQYIDSVEKALTHEEFLDHRHPGSAHSPGADRAK